MTDIRCVDCVKEGVTSKRPAPHGGPRSARCSTHQRAVTQPSKACAHELRTTNVPERAGRAQDKESEDAFEKLRRDGYM